jgi:hypothetical protein
MWGLILRHAWFPMRVLDSFGFHTDPLSRAAKVRVGVLLRMLVLVAVWQLIGPVAAYSQLSVSGSSPVAFNALAGNDTLGTLLTDSGSDADPADDDDQLLAGWSQRFVTASGVAFTLPLVGSGVITVEELRRPIGRTEAPPVPPPLPLF